MKSEWVEVRLEDVTTKLGDGLHGTPKYEEKGEYYFINGNNLCDGKIVIDEKTKRTSKEEYLKHRKLLTDRTILVSINGTIGNVAIYSGEKVVLGKSACYFNVKDEVDKQYIRYVVTSKLFQDYINSLATGSTIKNVSLKLMRDFRFYLPPLSIQRRLSNILHCLDDRIELNRQTNQTLEQIAQAIFKSWFVDFEPTRAKVTARDRWLALHEVIETSSPTCYSAEFDNGNQPTQTLEEVMTQAAIAAISGKTPEELEQLSPEQQQNLRNIAALFPDALVDSELGEIPQGWMVCPLKRIASFETGKVNTSVLSGKNYISTENMREGKGGIEFASSLPATTSVYAFKVGQILISNIRPYFKKIWLSRFEGGRSADVLAFQSNEGVSVEFLYNLLYQDSFFDFMMLTSKGAKMPRGDKAAIMNWLCVCPNSNVQIAFSNLVKSFYSIIDIKDSEAEYLTALRDLLLPKLLSGELNLASSPQQAEVPC